MKSFADEGPPFDQRGTHRVRTQGGANQPELLNMPAAQPEVTPFGISKKRGTDNDRLYLRGGLGCMPSTTVARQQNQSPGYPAARFWAEPIEERFDKVGTCEIYRVVTL